MKLHSFRLRPGQDLRLEIENYVKAKDIKAGFIITCVAGLRYVNVRMPGATPAKQDVRKIDGPLEVTSLVGTVSSNGSHLHITVTDKNGAAFGGHLRDDSPVRITAEIVIGEDQELIFSRELDDETGFEELKITPVK